MSSGWKRPGSFTSILVVVVPAIRELGDADMPMMNRPIRHTETTFQQHDIKRGGTPGFMLPDSRSMREPGTDFFTLITATGPATYKR